jgi:hypothetical protein
VRDAVNEYLKKSLFQTVSLKWYRESLLNLVVSQDGVELDESHKACHPKCSKNAQSD